MEYTVGSYVVAAILVVATGYMIWRHGHKTGKADAHETIDTVAEAVADHVNDFVDQSKYSFADTQVPTIPLPPLQNVAVPVAQPKEDNHYVKQGAISTLLEAVKTAADVKPDAEEHVKTAAKTAVELATDHVKEVIKEGKKDD